jgi:hypothetical protein
MKIFLDKHKEFEKNFKIKFDEPNIFKHTNGFLSVQVDWHSKKNTEDFWRFKYPELDSKTYGGVVFHKRKKYFNHSVSFNFPDLQDVDFEALKMTSWLDICIGYETEQEYASGCEFEFFNKTKYGLIAWFAPKGWEDWSNATKI